jgi:serine/threonine-protein kinase
MELVEGESPKGPMPFEDAWKIALQIADALEYAHEHGVVHRDLKPANLKVTRDGVVKLLDFGLAKAFSETPDASSADPENSPTITLGATVAGTVLGTAAYMAPEQAKGTRVDKRADIWSWGVVLYELLTGERLFKGDEAADTLAQVLTKEPNLDRVPPQARKVLRRYLEKDPRRRLRDIGDVSILLETAPGQPEEIGAKVVVQSASVLPWTIVALFAVAAVLGFVAYFRPTSASPQVLKVSVTLPEKAEFGDSPPAVSPDGHRIAFIAHSNGKDFLWVRDLDILSPRLLAGTDGADHPF